MLVISLRFVKTPDAFEHHMDWRCQDSNSTVGNFLMEKCFVFEIFLRPSKIFDPEDIFFAEILPPFFVLFHRSISRSNFSKIINQQCCRKNRSFKTCVGSWVGGACFKAGGGAVAGRDFEFVKVSFSLIDFMSHFFAPFTVFGPRSVLGPSPWQFSERENRRILVPDVRLAINVVALLELVGRRCGWTSFETVTGFAVCGRLNDEIPTPWFISFRCRLL